MLITIIRSNTKHKYVSVEVHARLQLQRYPNSQRWELCWRQRWFLLLFLWFPASGFPEEFWQPDRKTEDTAHHHSKAEFRVRFCYSGWLQHEYPRIYCEEQTAMGSWRLWINDICFHLDHLFCRGLGRIQGDLDQSLQWKSGQLLPVSQKFSCFQMRHVPVQGGGRQFLSKATLRHQGKREKYRFLADF